MHRFCPLRFPEDTTGTLFCLIRLVRESAESVEHQGLCIFFEYESKTKRDLKTGYSVAAVADQRIYVSFCGSEQSLKEETSKSPWLRDEFLQIVSDLNEKKLKKLKVTEEMQNLSKIVSFLIFSQLPGRKHAPQICERRPHGSLRSISFAQSILPKIFKVFLK